MHTGITAIIELAVKRCRSLLQKGEQSGVFARLCTHYRISQGHALLGTRFAASKNRRFARTERIERKLKLRLCSRHPQVE